MRSAIVVVSVLVAPTSEFDPVLPATNGGSGAAQSRLMRFAGADLVQYLDDRRDHYLGLRDLDSVGEIRHKLAVGHFVSAARITDSDLSMLYARVSTPALSTRPDFPLPAGRGGQVSKYQSTTR